MEQINCPHCGRDNPDSHNFCSYCGERLVDHCPRCHFPLTGQVNFCGNCGLGVSPRSQFLWQPDGMPLGTWPATPPSLTGAVESEVPVATPLAAPPAAGPRPIQRGLDQYIPRELMAKLEAARVNGRMFGERRIVTMLFCDVKGSTSAAGQLDPEEWTEIINGAFEYMIRPVYRYEGMVARLMGDAILAFFGAPIAHEDDPARAVLAGLDIVTGLATYQAQIQERWGLAIDVRVGINTGLVVVGAVGSDLRMEYTAMGDAINVAARMEQTAAPGTVQITHDTYKVVAPLFEIEDLGGVAVKGKDEPVPAYRVLARKADVAHMRGIAGLAAEMVGREEELGRLQLVLADLGRGVGRIVCLLGGAGLGKSRLVAELRRSQPGDSSLTWYETASLSYETSTPYALFQQLIRRMNGISAGEDAEQFWHKIGRLAVEIPDGDVIRYSRVFATLFGLPEPSGQPPLEGEQFKRELFAVMSQMWPALFASRPTVLVLDDLHWADPASIELLLHLLPTVETSSLVLLFVFRPDRGAPSYQLKQVADEEFRHRYTELQLGPLSEDESDELVNRLLAIDDLSDSVRDQIHDRAAGNPFYVEELIRTLIESGALIAEESSTNGVVRRHWRAASSDGGAMEIPQNLQGLLTSRIDRLEEQTRQVLQLASVIGRSFQQRVLEEIGRMGTLPVAVVDEQIHHLARLEIFQEVARVPDVEYRFRNPLMRQIAYQGILLKRRCEFHQRAGVALESLFPDRLAELASRLAYHYSQGQQADKALTYYTLAADQAFGLFALEEALRSYDQALECAEQAGAASKQLVHLYQRRGRVLELMVRHEEALETYQALEALGEARGDDSLRLAGISAQGIIYMVGVPDLKKAQAYADRALALARELGDRFTEARSLWSQLLTHTWTDSQKALEYGEEGLAIARELVAGSGTLYEHRELLGLLLMDLNIPLIARGKIGAAGEYASEALEVFEQIGDQALAATCAQRQATVYRVEGRFAKALFAFERSLEVDRSIGNEGGLVGSYLGLIETYPLVGHFGAFFDTVESLRQVLTHDQRVPLQVCEVMPITGYLQLGALDRALEYADVAWQFKKTQLLMWPDMYLCYLALAHVRAGDPESGRKALAGISNVLDLGNYMLLLCALVPQVRAELALAEGDWQNALSVVDDFLQKIRRDGVLSYLPEKLLLRARILCSAGQSQGAYEALVEAHGLALEQGARSMLWQICGQLARMEEEKGNLAQAETIYGDGRAAVDTIAAHAGSDELRASFLAQPEVQTILGKTGKGHE
jgi:class 3 adenylate cyclase/tetratricopeptide (TPR) repeat protein